MEFVTRVARVCGVQENVCFSLLFLTIVLSVQFSSVQKCLFIVG